MLNHCTGLYMRFITQDIPSRLMPSCCSAALLLSSGIDNRLTCCNGSCIAAPFNASNPEAACGIKAKPVCSFDQLMVKSSKFNAANAFVMAALSKAVYPDAWALPDNDTLVSLQDKAVLADICAQTQQITM